MLKRFYRFMMALVLSTCVASVAEAGNITQIGPVSGPGGTGSAVLDAVTSSAADLTLDFTSIAPLVVPLTVDGAGGYLIHTHIGEGPSLGIINDSGVPWTSFVFEVSGPPGTVANTIGFDNPQYFATGDIQPSYILLNSGTVPVGATLNIELGFLTSQAGDITLTYTPNATGPNVTPVPEPSSFLLCGLMSLSLVAARAIRSTRPGRITRTAK